MANWKGIIGKGILKEDFDAYVQGIVLDNWKPQFVVLHNTAIPSLSLWKKATGEEHMKDLTHYYRDTCGWSAGPHLFIADDFIWTFTPLNTSGVHSPSWNKISWGVELVGNYDMEELGDGVRDNAIIALSALHKLGNLPPNTLHLHHDDPRTTHKSCPGKNIIREDFIQQITDRLTAL